MLNRTFDRPDDIRTAVRQHYGEAAAKLSAESCGAVVGRPQSSCGFFSEAVDPTASRLYPAPS